MSISRTLNTAARPGVNPWIMAAAISLATFMELLDTSIANVSLRHIAGSLGASQDQSTWVLTSYLVSNAIIIPVSGWLSDVIGRKRFYMSCVALFTICSFLCGTATSLPLLLLFRVLQGAGGGGLAPCEQAILTDTFPPEQYGHAFAVYGLSVVVAPAIGPALGGWITDSYSWRWIFFLNVPVGILSLILTHLLVQDAPAVIENTRSKRQAGFRVDFIGFALTAAAFGTLQVVLDKGQEDDWFGSTFITAFAIVCFASFACMIAWELLVEPNPVLDLRLMIDPGLTASMALQFFVGFLLTATTVVIPLFVQQLLGYTATRAGMVLMPGGIALMVMMPAAGVLVNRIQPRYLMAAGLSLTALAMWYLTRFNTQVAFANLVQIRVLQCIGLPLFFVPLSTIAYGNLPAGKSNSASSLVNMMRNVGGSVGISFATTLLARRCQVHQNYLVSYASWSYHPFAQYMRAGGFTLHKLARYYLMLDQQAAMLSYIDVFRIFMVIALGIIVLVLVCLRRSSQPAGKGPVLVH